MPKAEIARPIFAACEKAGLKAFLDEEHIGWGESFTKKINTALGAARTIIVIVSSASVSKEWPLAEINTAIGLEVDGKKTVVPVMVGRPDLSHLPLLRAKRWIDWRGNPEDIVRQVRTYMGRDRDDDDETATSAAASRTASVPQVSASAPKPAAGVVTGRTLQLRGTWLSRLFSRSGSGKGSG